jgi:hypothetical protein
MERLERDDSGDIEIRTLDSYDLPSKPTIAVMKVDVEGSEALVIRGAEATIRKHRPIIAMEALGEDAEPLLGSFGYRRFPLSFCWTPTYVFYPSLAYLPALAFLGLRAKGARLRERLRARLASGISRARYNR